MKLPGKLGQNTYSIHCAIANQNTDVGTWYGQLKTALHPSSEGECRESCVLSA